MRKPTLAVGSTSMDATGKDTSAQYRQTQHLTDFNFLYSLVMLQCHMLGHSCAACWELLENGDENSGSDTSDDTCSESGSESGSDSASKASNANEIIAGNVSGTREVSGSGSISDEMDQEECLQEDVVSCWLTSSL